MRAEANSIHHGNVARLDAGDRVRFTKTAGHREDDFNLPATFDVTVAGVSTQNRFGPGIQTVEWVGVEDQQENHFYLDDDWLIELIPSSAPVKLDPKPEARLCRLHGIPDCSPLLNGCAELTKGKGA
jgi:hypothetical protein